MSWLKSLRSVLGLNRHEISTRVRATIDLCQQSAEWVADVYGKDMDGRQRDIVRHLAFTMLVVESAVWLQLHCIQSKRDAKVADLLMYRGYDSIVAELQVAEELRSEVSPDIYLVHWRFCTKELGNGLKRLEFLGDTYCELTGVESFFWYSSLNELFMKYLGKIHQPTVVKLWCEDE